MSDPFDDDCKNKFGDMMSEAFISAAGSQPRILWSPAETMAAFRSEVTVECLPQLVRMNRVDHWRTADRFAIHGATEHGPRKLLIYNQHQPSSDERPFTATTRIAFCKAILRDAIIFCNADAECYGFAFGGDANCCMAPWGTAFQEANGWNLTFQQPTFLEGVGRKGGDLMVAAAIQGVDMMIYENRCRVEGREKQHDCIFFKWSCRGFPRVDAPAWPFDRQIRPRIQETNPSALAEPARGASDPAGGNARGTSSASGVALEADPIERAEERQEAYTLEADDESSCGSVDWADMLQEDEDKLQHADVASASEHDDEAGASEHTEAFGNEEVAKHFDELAAIGFALATSASLFPQFSTHDGSRNCIGAAWMKPMTGACTEADREALNSGATMFFTRRPVLQSTPPRENKDHARILKSSAEIKEAWQLIFEKRRLGEPDDRRSIEDPKQLASMLRTWQTEWFAKELTSAQRKKPWRQKTSVFNAWLWSTLGSQHFVMAVWQTGTTARVAQNEFQRCCRARCYTLCLVDPPPRSICRKP